MIYHVFLIFFYSLILPLYFYYDIPCFFDFLLVYLITFTSLLPFQYHGYLPILPLFPHPFCFVKHPLNQDFSVSVLFYPFIFYHFDAMTIDFLSLCDPLVQWLLIPYPDILLLSTLLIIYILYPPKYHFLFYISLQTLSYIHPIMIFSTYVMSSIIRIYHFIMIMISVPLFVIRIYIFVMTHDHSQDFWLYNIWFCV